MKQPPLAVYLDLTHPPPTYLSSSIVVVSTVIWSKQPLSLPTSLFIFKNLAAHGYWQNRWYNEHTRQEREQLMRTITNLQVRLNLLLSMRWPVAHLLSCTH